MSATVTGDAAWRARQRARLLREGLVQGAVALVVIALFVGFAQNVVANLEARQIKSGFGFLNDPAGFNIGELLFEYSARDSYLRAFAVGMANTLRVSLAGIVLASVLGVVVGLMRLSRHALVSWLGSAYVEVFRNTPLLIQLLAIYLLLTELLPDSSSAIAIEGIALLLGVDRFMSQARSITNLIGNGAATLVISRSENEFDENMRASAIVEIAEARAGRS